MSMDRCLRSAKNAPVVSPALPEVRGEVGVGGRGNSRGLPEATTAHLSPLETLLLPDSSLSPFLSHHHHPSIIRLTHSCASIGHDAKAASERGRAGETAAAACIAFLASAACRRGEREARVAREVLLSLSFSFTCVLVRVRPCRAPNEDFPEVANKRAIKCVISVARD